MLRIVIACLALLAPVGAASAVQAGSGTLVIVGGGLDPGNAAIFAELLDARPADAPGIAIIPAASSEPTASAQAFKAALLRHGANAADILMIRLAMLDDPGTADVDESRWRSHANDPAEIAAIERAGAIWFTGGDQSRITALLVQADGRDTPMLAAIRQRLAQGAVIGGTSAGAAIMTAAMITQGDTLAALLPDTGGEALGLGLGLGFLPGALVDQHFGERARLGRLAVALTKNAQPHRIGIGIDEDTALVVTLATGTARVAGNGYVTVLDARQAARLVGRRFGVRGLVLGLAGAGDAIDIASASVTPATFKQPTIGREYVNRPLPSGGGMAYGAQTVATVVGEGLLDNSAVRVTERYSFAGPRGVTYRFHQTSAARGWWGRDPAGSARYALNGVRFDITPITVAIKKVAD